MVGQLALEFEERSAQESVPLVPESGLFLAEHYEGEKLFAAAFRIAWERLPGDAREALLVYWQQIRETRGQRVPMISGFKGAVLEVAPDRFRGTKDVLEAYPELREFDWAQVPVIRLKETLGRTQGMAIGGLCCWCGAELDFSAQILTAGLDFVQECVAHELAHAFVFSCGTTRPAGATPVTWTRHRNKEGAGWEERLVNELLAFWGFAVTENPRTVLRRIRQRAYREVEREWKAAGRAWPGRKRL